MKPRSSQIPGLNSSLQEEVSLGKLLHFVINSYLWFTQHINHHTTPRGLFPSQALGQDTEEMGRFVGCRLWCGAALSSLKVTQSLQTGITARLSSVGKIKAGLSPHLHDIKMKSPAQAMFSSLLPKEQEKWWNPQRLRRGWSFVLTSLTSAQFSVIFYITAAN